MTINKDKSEIEAILSSKDELHFLQWPDINTKKTIFKITDLDGLYPIDCKEGILESLTSKEAECYIKKHFDYENKTITINVNVSKNIFPVSCYKAKCKGLTPNGSK